MVYLNRIYTRTGDDGQTGLGNGDRVSKTHPRVVAYGAVDELNSVLGMVLAAALPDPYAAWLSHIQNDLFDLGADLCVPEAIPSDESDGADDSEDSNAEPAAPAVEPLRMTAGQVEQVERWIDTANADLQPLTSFILPGGTPAAAHLHLARTVCRRAEINVLHLAEFESINPQTHIYLNRLSDLLFVLCRVANGGGTKDVLWVPGKNRGN